MVACGNVDTNTLSDGILSREQMVEVITDIQLLDAAQKSLPISGSKQKRMKDTTYAIIYAHHGIDHTTFDSSLRAYSLYPKLMGEIMENVTEKINAKN